VTSLLQESSSQFLELLSSQSSQNKLVHTHDIFLYCHRYAFHSICVSMFRSKLRLPTLNTYSIWTIASQIITIGRASDDPVYKQCSTNLSRTSYEHASLIFSLTLGILYCINKNVQRNLVDTSKLHCLFHMTLSNSVARWWTIFSVSVISYFAINTRGYSWYQNSVICR
jgi:hypothetical protein